MDRSEGVCDKIPFYMSFPIKNMYEAELEYEQDMDRMKSLYPKEIAKYQKLVEERCDELEAEGGRIFDEEPDRIMMQQEADRIYNSIKDVAVEVNEKKNYFAMVMSCDGKCDDNCDNNLCNLIRVLFYNEAYRRRCRNRRCRRWW